MLSIDGLVSGIDTTSIIEGLTSIQQNQIDLLEGRRTDQQDKQTSFKGVEAGLISLRGVAGRLGRANSNVFSSRTVTSGNEDILSATASSNAAIGVFTVTVNQLAQAHQVGSQGFASENSEVSQGTISLAIGGDAATEITIDESNNTLSGLADAINNSDSGVAATIINDGSNGGSAFRLLLTASQTGESNAINITNNLTTTSGSAVQPDFSGPAIQEATNASITLGSGPGAINVENATNTVENVIDGVTMKLTSAKVGQPVSLSVGRDTEAGAAAVQDFVDSFNSLMSYIDDQSAFNPEAESAGLLLGDRPTISIQDELRRAVTDSVADVDSNANRLSAIGISMSSTGKLVLNSSRLNAVLSGEDPDIKDSDLTKLFAFSGDSTNANVRFLGGSTRTAHGTPIEVDVTQAATQATVSATNTLAALTTIDGTNDTLSLEVDGAEATVTLNHGDYTETELAELVQDAVNNSSELSGRSLAVNVEDNLLKITSETYGRTSQLDALTGSALTALGLDGSENDRGQDVVGRFIVDGEIEQAIGRGRLLTGNADNEFTGDLQVSVTMTDSQVQAGVEATLTLTRGVGSKLDTIIGKLVDPVSGRVKTANDAFDQQIEDIDIALDRQNELFESSRDRLIAEFSAMESAISQLNSTASFLTTQFASAS